MKFLLKLVYLSGLFGLLAAKSDDTLPANASAVASQVICGGRTWTHDEFLGNVGGKPVYTIINENRIYIRWDGNPDQSQKRNAFDNTAILLHMDNNRFPNNVQGNYVVNHCVNSVDPSTMSTGFLQPAVGNGIPCNNKLITDRMLLGTYIGGDGVKTYQYSRIINGLLRVNFHRETNNYDPNSLSMGLIRQTIEGENGSFMNPNLGFQLNYLEVQSCFWGDLPKYPDSVIGDAPNCESGPTVGTISNITPTALRFTYAGNGVPNIDWRIKSNGTTVRSARTGQLNGTNVDISFSTLSAGDYILEIQGGDCSSSVSSKSFSISSGPFNCLAGPNLELISNVTQTSLRFVFDGNGVNNIDWRIKSNGTTVRSARTPQLSSPIVNISYASLGAGNYTLEILGGDCISSVSSKPFTIDVTPENCVGGPTISTIRSVTATSLTVDFTGTDIPNFSWQIKKGSAVMASGETGNLSSNSTTLNFINLSNGNYNLEIKGLDCISSVSSKAFNISDTDTRQPCAFGPFLRQVIAPSETGLTFNFHGDGVSNIDWKIMRGNTMMRQNRVTLANDHPTIQYAALSQGQYRLDIQGGACESSVSSMNFTVGDPLPINIASFQGKALKSGIELTWTVVSEKNGQGFEVIRLDDQAKKSEVIGNVALTEQRTGEYQFLDSVPRSGVNYYQLKQIDADGTFTNSKIIAIEFNPIFEVIVAPNPAKEYINVSYRARAAGNSTFDIYNMAGIRLSSTQRKITMGENTTRINVSNLADGHYFLKVSSGDQGINLRFIKTH